MNHKIRSIALPLRLSPCKRLLFLQASTFVLVTLIVASCANIITTQRLSPEQKITVQQQWLERTKHLHTKQTIIFEGRAVVSSKGSVWNFSLQWKQQGDNFEGSGYSLLGNQIFAIKGNTQFTQFTYDGKKSTLQSSQEVIATITGLHIAPNALFALVLADISGALTTTFVDNTPSEQTIADSVHAQYLTYKNYNHVPMPHKIHISTPQGELKLAVNKWVF